MITIPESVKALFQADSVFKNFHVRFPNGECADLNNENIEAESVVFTESLCSQQYFKFGLAEASSIEFTAMGIPNVRGCVIQCGIEIDVSSLGSSFITQNPVDDTLPFLTPQTVQLPDGRYGYRVPYGEFVIDTCPRDHGAMFRRQVTAYTTMPHSNEDLSPIQQWAARKMMRNNASYKPNAQNLVYGTLGWYDISLLEAFYTASDRTWTESQLTIPSLYSTMSCSRKNQEWEGLTFQYKIGYLSVSLADANESKDAIYSLITGGIDWSPMEEVFEYFNAKYFLLSSGMAWPTTFQNIFGKFYEPGINYDGLGYGPSNVSFENWNCIYVYRGPVVAPRLIIPYYLDFIVQGETGEHFVDLRPQIASNLVLKEWTRENSTPINTLKLTLKSTATGKVSVNGKKYRTSSYTNAYDYCKVAEGFLELCGRFLKPSRSGRYQILALDSSNSIGISASDWQEFWWDENEISPIGQVTVSYTDGKKEQTETFVVDEEGGSLYDMSGNEVLKNTAITAAEVEQLLEESFLPNAAAVNFTPIEASVKGLPYLETGDYVSLTAKDGETVSSFILRQEISGIQNITAEILSTNGELMEVE